MRTMIADYICPLCRAWTAGRDKHDLKVGVKVIKVCAKCLREYNTPQKETP